MRRLPALLVVLLWVVGGVTSSATGIGRMRPRTVAGQGAGAGSGGGNDIIAPTDNGVLSLVESAQNQINLSWSAASDNIGVAGYKIVRSTSGAPTVNCTADTTIVSNQSGTTYSNTGLTTNVTYYYRVCARDARGNFSTGVTNSLLNADITAPSINSFTVTAQHSAVSLSWSATDNVGITNYDLRYSTGSAPADCSSGSSVYSGTNTSYSHTGLGNNVARYYRLCATDAAANSSSSTGNATPLNLVSFGPDGTNEYVNVPDNTSIINSSTNFSVSTWVRVFGGCSSSNAFLMGQWSAADTDDSWRLITVDSTTNCFLRVCIAAAGNSGCNTRVQTDANFFPDNDGGDSPAWVHVVVTYNAGTITIYKNGASVASTATGTIPTSIRDSALALTFGADAAAGVAFVGYIDDTSGWNVTLTSGNVTTLYNGGVPIAAADTGISGLQWEYWMGDRDTAQASPATVTDRSGGGHNGTTQNCETADFDSTVFAP